MAPRWGVLKCATLFKPRVGGVPSAGAAARESGRGCARRLAHATERSHAANFRLEKVGRPRSQSDPLNQSLTLFFYSDKKYFSIVRKWWRICKETRFQTRD